MKSEKTSMRRQLHIKLWLPSVVGIFLGIALSHLYSPINEDVCKPESIIHNKNDFQKLIKRNNIIKKPSVVPMAVKPKSSHFNYDFRPYFIYSELGFYFDVVVAVMTYEKHLETFALAINNTWSQDLTKVVFFTAYSKDSKFHERYNVKLNLNVVQLPDIVDGSSSLEFSFRILKYMKDHFVNSYKWFVQTPDNVYLEPDNLMQFLSSLNSTMDAYIGHPVELKTAKPHKENSRSTPRYYCSEKSAIIFSRTTLLKLSITPTSIDLPFDAALAESVFKDVGIHCRSNGEFSKLFPVDDTVKQFVTSPNKNEEIVALSKLTSPNMFYEIAKKIYLQKLQKTKQYVEKLQHNIRSLVIKLPKDVPEKQLHWPIGFPPPFKPSSRFEVIKWTYFDESKLYAFTDEETVSSESAYLKDVSTILGVIGNAMRKEYSIPRNKLKFINGYRRLDPQRGAEYSIDISTNSGSDKQHDIIRIHLLRPFTNIEALSMPAATEQKGIHIVLPVMREDIQKYERFLQLYKRVCLQTGENVVLLTVFINIRGGTFEGGDNDQFVESKRLIARYKQSYMWAQLPWLQVGVKQPSSVLLMDIVSMKLPSNALIFLMSLSTEFTINFLNRCRVNVVNGMQVFFPIPFVQYDSRIAYRNKPLPAFVDVHRDNGFWDENSDDIACFNNRDYKDLRIGKSNFLDESSDVERSLLNVFRSSKIQIFRAVDSELRKTFMAVACSLDNSTQHDLCMQHASRRYASRAQLAYHLFQKNTVI